jgi:hypothetical protein
MLARFAAEATHKPEAFLINLIDYYFSLSHSLSIARPVSNPSIVFSIKNQRFPIYKRNFLMKSNFARWATLLAMFVVAISWLALG